jgi:hypothetical protein
MLGAPGLTWFLLDLDDGFDNRNDYLRQSQNQNNDMSFTHLLSSRRAWTKGRAEPEVHNYSKKQIIMRYSKRRTFGALLPIRPSSRGQTLPPVLAGGFVLSLARPAMQSFQQREFVRTAIFVL